MVGTRTSQSTMKTSRELYGVLLSIAALHSILVGAATITEFTATQTLVKVGATITFHCQVKDMDFTSFVKYGKYIEGLQEPVVLSINTVKQSSIKEIVRYKMNVIKQTAVSAVIYDFILRIENASLEDTGNYTCSIPSDDQHTQTYRTLRVDVLVEPKSLRMYVDGVELLVDGIELGYEEGFHSVNCTVGPSNPPAQLAILSDRNTIISSPNNSVQRIHSKTPGQIADVLVSILYETTNEVNVELTHNDVKKSISCMAKIPGSAFSITKAVTFKLFGHVAQFQCPDVIKISASVKEANITCTVRASPVIKILSVYWSLPLDDVTSTSRQNQTLMADLKPSDNWLIKKEYQAKVYQKGDELKFIIKFPQLIPEIYRTYFFVARNPHGTAVHEVTLQKPNVGPILSESRSRASHLDPAIRTIAITFTTFTMRLIMLIKIGLV